MTLLGSPPLTAIGSRVVIIVARDRPELFEYFRRAFTGVGDVGIIVDRRLPHEQADTDDEAELAGQCWQPDVYDELTLRGFVIKRL